MANCDGCNLPLPVIDPGKGEVRPTSQGGNVPRIVQVVEPLLLVDAPRKDTYSFHGYACLGQWVIDQRHVLARYDAKGWPEMAVNAL